MGKKRKKRPVREAPLPAAPSPKLEKSESESTREQTTRINKERFLHHLELEHGVISVAAEKSGVALSTVYAYIKADKAFSELVEEIRLCAGGYYVEGKLFERIEGVQVKGRQGVYSIPPSVEAIKIYLQSERGAKLGYMPVGKQKNEHEITRTFAILEIPDNGRSLKGLEPDMPPEIAEALDEPGAN